MTLNQSDSLANVGLRRHEVQKHRHLRRASTQPSAADALQAWRWHPHPDHPRKRGEKGAGNGVVMLENRQFISVKANGLGSDASPRVVFGGRVSSGLRMQWEVITQTIGGHEDFTDRTIILYDQSPTG
jgi:hypothetical protein